MPEYVEKSGPSLKKSREAKKKLHHIRIYPRGAPEDSPEFLVEHHYEGGGDPEAHTFSDGHAMLAHAANHAGVRDENVHATEDVEERTDGEEPQRKPRLNVSKANFSRKGRY